MNHNPEEQPNQEPRWRKFERGQALMEYWPVVPVGVAVMIVAGAIMPIMTNAFQKTADGLTGIECEVTEPNGSTSVDLNGGHNIELSSYVYDPDTDRTTLAFTVTSGSQPSISHWVLGLDEATASNIVSSSEAYESWQQDPTTGKWGIKFDTGYEGGSGGGGNGGGGNGGGGNGGGGNGGGGNNDAGNPGGGGNGGGNGGGGNNDAGNPGGGNGGGGNGGGNNGGGNGGGKGKGKASVDTGLMLASGGTLRFASYTAVQSTSGETRTIVLTLSGNVTLEQTEVTTKAGSNQVSTGTISTPATPDPVISIDGDC